MASPILHEAIPPVPVTALITDIRNFTPHLLSTRADDQGINHFCHYLSNFYSLCLEACLTAIPPDERSDPPLFVSSTGDGMLVLFLRKQHAVRAFLASILLNKILSHHCDAYNQRLEHPQLPHTSFGIGVESGTACRVRALSQDPDAYPVVDTYIGNCINVAARVESVTKMLHRSRTLISRESNQQLCQAFFKESYHGLEETAMEESTSDAERLAIYEKMESWHQELCMTYVHHHVLKGVDHPLPVFRLSESSIRLGNARFELLLERLVDHDPGHLEEVHALLRRNA